MIKKILLGVFGLALLALDWAALHDILQGTEPDLVGEYAILLISALVFLVLFMWRRSLGRLNR